MTDDLIARLREAFDGDSAPAKNIALRKAADALEAQARRIAELEEEKTQFREALAKGFEEFAPDTTWRSCDLAYMIRNFDVWNIERNRRAARDALGEKND